MDISYLGLGLSALLVLIPLLIFFHLKLKLTRQLFYSYARMIIQLALIGLILQFIFGQKEDIILQGTGIIILFL